MSICFSGGALGADTIWTEVASHYGHDVINYIFDGHKSTCSSLAVLTDDELSVADYYLTKANSIVQRRFPTKSKTTNSLLRRNYYQIKDSDSCYAVSSIDDNKISGGTAWAVAMFIQNRSPKPVFVLNQDDSLWYYYDYNISQYILCDDLPLTPSGNWTGIGTRDITNESIDMIIELFERK